MDISCSNYVSKCYCRLLKPNFRQENQLAKRLAGWGIGEEANPAVCVLNSSPILNLIHTIHFPLTFLIDAYLESWSLFLQDFRRRKVRWFYWRLDLCDIYIIYICRDNFDTHWNKLLNSRNCLWLLHNSSCRKPLGRTPIKGLPTNTYCSWASCSAHTSEQLKMKRLLSLCSIILEAPRLEKEVLFHVPCTFIL